MLSYTHDGTEREVEYDPRTALFRREGGLWHEVHFPGTAGYDLADSDYRAACDAVIARVGRFGIECDQVARFGHLF